MKCHKANMENDNKTTRRGFLKVTGAGLMTMMLSSCASFDAKMREGVRSRPNVVLILVDDLGWTDLGCFGSSYYQTPNIDKLCREGMKFTDAYAACAVCSPTRAAILTGRSPARLGITDWIRPDVWAQHRPPLSRSVAGYADLGRKLLFPVNQPRLPKEEITLPEILKQQGYATCHIGKWHLGGEGFMPEDHGFDHNIGGFDMGQPPSYYDPYENEEVGGIPTLKPRKGGEYLSDRLADEACVFLKQHRNDPFFLYMSHYTVHTPIQGRKDLVDKYNNIKPTGLQKNAEYAAMVEAMDQAVGQIMVTLDKLKLAENTLVIFTSDNGGYIRNGITANEPLRGGKGHAYEGGIRVPMIVRWPGKVPPATVSAVPVISMDCLPTICEAVACKAPVNRAIDGTSLMSALTQSGDMDRKAIYWHYPHFARSADGVIRRVPYSIVRSGRWKLIYFYDAQKHELYDLSADISEKNDLATVHPEKVKQLHNLLMTHLKQVGAKLPVPNPDYQGE